MNVRPPSPPEWVTPEQAATYADVLDFARTLPRDVARDLDRSNGFDHDTWVRCGRFGLTGLPAEGSYGGGDADVVTTMLALEALGYGCVDNGLVFSINAHLWTSVVPIWEFGAEEQREKWLPGLCAGELIGCHAMTEPGAGSDPFSLTATARPTSDGYVLNGRKTFITNAPVADVVVVFARTGEAFGPYGITAFIVPAGTPGLDVSGEIHKMGLRTSPMSEVVLEDCVVSASAVLGRVGRGAEVFQHSMRWERACIMASQVGLMRRTMDSCIAYARERTQFGQPIAKFEAVADRIADMQVAVDAGRALVLRVGWLMDRGEDTTKESAVAKLFVSEASVKTHLDAVQIFGGYGYAEEFEIERALRDTIGGRIYSGTSDIQRRIIAGRLGL